MLVNLHVIYFYLRFFRKKIRNISDKVNWIMQRLNEYDNHYKILLTNKENELEKSNSSFK